MWFHSIAGEVHCLQSAGKWFTMVSRALEDNCKWTLANLHKLLEELPLEDPSFSYLRFWNDKGPHYCASEYLASNADFTTSKYRKHFQMRIGPEYHAKWELGCFGISHGF